ncbi:MAG: hypothetical protein QM775_11715 [Pirellulales bacterium]
MPSDGATAWVVLVLVAWIVRIVYLGEIYPTPQAHLLIGDAEVYDAWAKRIVAGQGFEGVYYQAPLYPHFLAAVYMLGGGVTAVKFVQGLLGAISCVLLGRRAALV